jgi:hypothetical protein
MSMSILLITSFQFCVLAAQLEMSHRNANEAPLKGNIFTCKSALRDDVIASGTADCKNCSWWTAKGCTKHFWLQELAAFNDAGKTVRNDFKDAERLHSQAPHGVKEGQEYISFAQEIQFENSIKDLGEDTKTRLRGIFSEAGNKLSLELEMEIAQQLISQHKDCIRIKDSKSLRSVNAHRFGYEIQVMKCNKLLNDLKKNESDVAKQYVLINQANEKYNSQAKKSKNFSQGYLTHVEFKNLLKDNHQIGFKFEEILFSKHAERLYENSLSDGKRVLSEDQFKNLLSIQDLHDLRILGLQRLESKLEQCHLTSELLANYPDIYKNKKDIQISFREINASMNLCSPKETLQNVDKCIACALKILLASQLYETKLATCNEGKAKVTVLPHTVFEQLRSDNPQLQEQLERVHAEAKQSQKAKN